jgi:hypothetical protein
MSGKNIVPPSLRQNIIDRAAIARSPKSSTILHGTTGVIPVREASRPVLLQEVSDSCDAVRDLCRLIAAARYDPFIEKPECRLRGLACGPWQNSPLAGELASCSDYRETAGDTQHLPV